jgi:hypothetical protein
MKLNSQKGMTMVITLIVIFIFTMLGSVIWHYSNESVAHSDRSFRNRQAYYIARSGIEAFTTYVFNNDNYSELTDTISRLIDKSSDPFEIGDKGGTCVLRLMREDGIVLVEATGTYEGAMATAVLELKEEDAPYRLFNNAIFATDNSNDSISVTGNADVVGGPVETKGKLATGGQPIYFDYIENSNREDYPRVTFPPKLNDNDIDVRPGNVHRIDGNSPKYYKDIYVQYQGTIIFDTSRGDIIISGERVRLYGHVLIEGPNRVYLYCQNEFLSQIDRGAMNHPFYHEPIDSLVVLMPETGIFTCYNFGGLLYAPGATINLMENATFTGSMIGGKIGVGGNAVIEYVPEAASVTPDIFDGLSGVTWPSVEDRSKQYVKGMWRDGR